jgi:hypothetical protein
LEKAKDMKKRKITSEQLDPEDYTLVVRAEGSKSVAKKEWIHTHTNLTTESKLKLRKEIEELNKTFDSRKKNNAGVD